MYVLIRVADGKYVARTGYTETYTRQLEHAQTFHTQEKADAARCRDNERVVDLKSILKPK